MPPAPRAFPSNLPLALSSFIGRGREIEAVKRLLSSTRLLTLTGAGGSGKTRLALWVAEELGPSFAHGAWLVELAPLADPALVPQTVASALGLREERGRPAAERLTEHLLRRQLLLLLDNCEHLVGACAQLAETLLRACPGLRLLATSREALNLPGETVWLVPALSVPAAAAGTGAPALDVPQALQSEAVRLFVERATAASPAFSLTLRSTPAVVQVCRQLDGLPLAIELAAARVRALSVEQIAERLATHERFRLLSAGSRTAPPRQQTLAATLDWSYQLLSEPERVLLRRLSVFAGGWTLAAAEAVAVNDEGRRTNDESHIRPSSREAVLRLPDVLETLSHLVDKSLVLAHPAHGETRYHLLETIRQYAAEKLAEAGHAEAAAARDRHLHYFAGFAEKAEPFLEGPALAEWLGRYAAEHDNLRAALEWGRASAQRAQAGLRLAAASGRFLRLRGFLSEGRAHLEAAIQMAKAHPPADPAVLARALYASGALAYLQSDYPVAHAQLEESLAIYQGLGPAGERGVAGALGALGEVATEEGDYVTAPALFEQSLTLWRKLGHTRGIADVLMQLGWASLRTGQYEQAVPRLEESLALFRQIGDAIGLAFSLAGLGEAAVRQGQYDRAQRLLEESLALRRAHGDKWSMGASLGTLGWLALRQGDYARVRAVMAESLALRLEVGDKGGLAWCLEKLAEAAVREGLGAAPPPPGLAGLRRAARVYAAAAALRAPVGSVIDPADQDEHERTVAALRAALGDEAYEAAWAEGRRLPLEQVVAEALAEPEAPTKGAPAPPARGQPSPGGLTPREREVAVLIAQGMSNREIAAALVVGARTAETYISRILSKLGFTSRVQIATWAIEKGLAAPPVQDEDSV